MADQPLPVEIQNWMQAHNWGMHHLRWHTERQWDRLLPAERAQLASQGWERAAIQEGAPGNGLEFLLMHRAMIQLLMEEFPANSSLFLGWTSPPTDPNNGDDPVPAGSPIPGPFNPSMQDAIDRLTTNLSSFASEDELGVYIETRFRPTPANPANRSPDPSTGIHNYLHGRFTDNASPLNMGDPLVNLGNVRFWKLHGWIDGRWSAFRTLHGLSDANPEYLNRLQSEKNAMLGGHHHAPHGMEAATLETPASIRDRSPLAIPSSARRPFMASAARRLQELLTATPTITTREELIEYLQTAVQVEHATLPLYLTAMWSLKNQPKHKEILRGIALQEMLHFGIVCNLLWSIGADPHIVPPDATLPVFPGQLPGLDLSDTVSGDISLEAFSTFGADPKSRIRLFMRIEEPEGGDIDPTESALSTEAVAVPRFHSIGELYDVIIAGVESLAQTGAITFQAAGQVGPDYFPEMTLIESSADAVRLLYLIKEQGEGTTSSQASGASSNELAHYYRFKQIAEEMEYSWTDGHPKLDPTKPLPFPTSSQVRSFVPAPTSGHPQSAAFDAVYSRMLDGLHRAWHGEPDALSDAVWLEMFNMTTEAVRLMDMGFGPNFRYVPSATSPANNSPVQTEGVAGVASAATANAEAAISGYARIRQILDEAVQGEDFGAHGPVWRSLTRDQFVVKSIFGRPLIAKNADGTFNPDESNLVKSLEGRAPFGKDLTPPPAGAMFKRMPDGYPPVPQTQINEIRAWIVAGCPDIPPAAASIIDSSSAGSLTSETFVGFWRGFDDVAMFEATEEMQADIGNLFNAAVAWFDFANNPSKEGAWNTAISVPEAAASIRRLEAMQRQMVLQTFGTPVKLADLLACWERFGDNTLPDDPLRPVDPRHTMNGELMWFFWAAFIDAALRQSSTDATIPTDFWEAMSRAVLLGIFNDGVFRARFPVIGFPTTNEGKQAMRDFVRDLPRHSLGLELRTRYVQSGL